MKTNILLKLIFFIVNFIFLSAIAQNSGKIYYKKIQNNKVNECFLLYDKNQSIFVTENEKAITKPYMDADGSLITPSNTIDSIANKKHFVYFDRIKQNFYTNNINNDQEIIILLDRNIEKWIITKEQKKIGNFNCFKAIKSSNNKNYIAWFTTEIPFPYGPIAINGLKGIILELHTDDNSLHFVFQKYEISNENVNSYIRFYDFEKAISYNAYLELKKMRNKEFKERAILNAPAGAIIVENKENCDTCN